MILPTVPDRVVAPILSLRPAIHFFGPPWAHAFMDPRETFIQLIENHHQPWIQWGHKGLKSATVCAAAVAFFTT